MYQITASQVKCAIFSAFFLNINEAHTHTTYMCIHKWKREAEKDMHKITTKKQISNNITINGINNHGAREKKCFFFACYQYSKHNNNNNHLNCIFCFTKSQLIKFISLLSCVRAPTVKESEKAPIFWSLQTMILRIILGFMP